VVGAEQAVAEESPFLVATAGIPVPDPRAYAASLWTFLAVRARE
jgi:hypothetical protein